MPEMIAVGNTGIQPDPLGSISKMIGARSGIIGLQQQQIGLQQARQNLQTGQYTQQSAQATAQVDQQQAAQLQALANFTKAAVSDPTYQKPDGSLDSDKFLKGASTVAPTQQAKIGEALSNANAAITNKRAVASLTGEQNKLAGGYWASVAGNPNATDDDIKQAAKLTRGIDPKNALLQDSVDNALMHFGQAQTPQQKQQIASGISSMLTGASPLTSGTNAAGQSQVVNTLTQARTAPDLSGGATNPSGPQVAGETVRQTALANSDIDRANQVAALQQQSSASIPLTQRIDQLADDINSGKVAKMISETGNYFGVSSVNEARAQLNKDLGQVKGLAIQNSGSDARAATVLEGYPTDTTPPQTIHAAMDYIRGTARQNLARGKLYQQYQQSDNGFRGFQAADSMLTANSNPLMHEYMALPSNQRAGFYKRNFSTPQEAQAFKDQVGAMQRHTTGIVDGSQ